MEAGVTETLPEVAPPVLKFVPEQDEAPTEDQVSVVESPENIVVGLALIFIPLAGSVTVTTAVEIASEVPALEQVIVYV